MRWGGVFFGALLLAGCVPAEAPPAPRAAPVEKPSLPVDLEPFGGVQVWEAKPAIANAKNVAGSIYEVVSGDTLRAVGARTGAGAETLARVNGLVDPYVLRTGQKLTVPAGRYHAVAAGETGIAIARAYAVPWRAIIDANALIEPFALRVGQRLVLPGPAASPAPPSIEQRAAAFRLEIDDILTGGEPATAVTIAPTPPPRVPAIPLASGFAWPATGKVVGRFGKTPTRGVSQGIEIAVPPGAPIRATADGIVAFVGDNVAPFGGVILIRHGGGWISAYGRAGAASVAKGDTVKRGTTIGRAGTGASPQLHFELRRNRVPVDPLGQLPKV